MRARTVTGRPGRNIALIMLVATLVIGTVVVWRRPTRGRPTALGATPASTGAAPVTPSSAAGPATPGPSPVAFHATVDPVPPAVAAAMNGVSWRPGCPVPVSVLRMVQLTFWGFDNAPHQGELIVHADVAQAIVRIFRKLYAARFPIRKMRLIDAYGGSDDRSMADDNTSMFNCRNAYGSTHWSMHAYGKAIDVNTVENPYLPGHAVLPAAGAAYLDRHNVRPGMIVGGDLVTKAFAAEGFRWGGDWTSGTDYQHFEIGS